jgi:hypothetical protein
MIKRWVPIAAVCILFFVTGAFVAAQSNSSANQQSEVHYINVSIERIYVDRMGYIVVYRKGPHHMARAFIPDEWFTRNDQAQAEFVRLGPGSEWPSMTVFYRNGEFSHVRLRVRRNRGHESWGAVPRNVNLDDFFQGVEEVKLEF